MKERKEIRILVAEDDFLVSEMVSGMLEELGYTIVGKATNGQEAIEKNQKLRPDIVVMDVQMPGMSGIQAAEIIQQTSPTPVVILTAHESQELVNQASRAGIAAYLLKPPDSRTLERAITIALARFQDLQQMRAINQELLNSNQELDSFAHTVAHDLQNPLSLVIGFSELLIQNYDEYSDAERKDLLKTINRNAHKLSNIIDELLLLAGVRNAEVVLEPFDLKLTALEAKMRLSDMIEDYQAEVVIPDEMPMALGHAPWVEEVWVNYLSNGIKYGGQPPRLEIGAEVCGDYVRCWVQDNGEGIDPAELDKLFVPFNQLKQVRTKGHGLGLSIVHRIVTRLNGEVGVESMPGKGSRFWFTLPNVKS
ncbi:MAG: hybrid sensor histidine kinase/response regulator [Chloroflexi bacterium]|nr:MAG: hybrid sensor histidine kinase/response regulator [Chloroflexota bacterium]